MRVIARDASRQVPVLIILIVLASCGKKAEAPVIPPATSPLSRAYIGYGVVNVSYTYMTENPAEEGVSPGYLRRGSVICILERKVVKRGQESEAWVLAEGGWLREEIVDIYENELQARTAAGSMIQ
jgi:hypothetical protein